ncbi:nascent polypeptide-associated complex subunit alpha [Candidatus Methanophagaceae archaeon]|nr:nascent polypeptide-associated complex subunit alpha [Methanophagales archaeon]
MHGGFRKGAGISSKKMSQMMKQTGINIEELSGVEEVVIKMVDSELVFPDASVTIMDAQGVRMYQITGTPEKRAKSEQEEPEELIISTEDVELVMEKAGCTEEKARAALIETNGDFVDAISKLCVE